MKEFTHTYTHKNHIPVEYKLLYIVELCELTEQKSVWNIKSNATNKKMYSIKNTKILQKSEKKKKETRWIATTNCKYNKQIINNKLAIIVSDKTWNCEILFWIIFETPKTTI